MCAEVVPRRSRGHGQRWRAHSGVVLTAPVRDDEPCQSKTRARRESADAAENRGNMRVSALVSSLQWVWLVKALELDTGALVERVALAVGTCLGVGSLSRTTGAV